MNTSRPPLLDLGAHQHACSFIEANANPLQSALFAWYRTGTPTDVLSALAAYQNPDGGFGHGLEPDLRTASSSVLATTVALQTLMRLQAPADEPLVSGALSYLRKHYDGRHWHLISEDCNDAPHAPWWTWDARQIPPGQHFVPNPGAEILGYWFSWPEHADADQRQDLANRAVIHLARGIEMHDLLCYLRLLETPALPNELYERMLPALLERTLELVVIEPEAWNGYVLKPFDVVTGPGSPLAGLLAGSLDTSLTWEIARQSDDGAWYPHWTWGGAYTATWQVVRTEIAVDLTLRMLTKLRDFGLVAPPEMLLTGAPVAR